MNYYHFVLKQTKICIYYRITEKNINIYYLFIMIEKIYLLTKSKTKLVFMNSIN